MRKFFLLIFSFIITSCGFAQDPCYKMYMEAMQKYKRGNYVEAQRELVIVAQTCGNYSDVWKELKDCNKKLADIQTQQAAEIKKLKDKNETLEKEKADLKSENVDQKAKAASRVLALQDTIKKKNQSIADLNREIVQWKDSVKTWKDNADTLNNKINNFSVMLKRSIDQVDSLQKENDNLKMPGKTQKTKPITTATPAQSEQAADNKSEIKPEESTRSDKKNSKNKQIEHE